VTVLRRFVAVLFVLIGLFLIAAVISALFSAGGAKAGVAVLYVLISIALFIGARYLWREPSGTPPAPPPPAA
jgi:uncharacterized membrane protein